eukprot:scaffold275727_cov27-Tisochrysis_lutea.AAC.3
MDSAEVCRFVLRTRRELEVQSETHDAARPSKADRSNLRGTSPSGAGGSLSFNELYVRNQG